MRYHFKIHKEKKGFWAECLELAGCMTQADSREQLEKNMADALNLYLEETEDIDYLAPLPKESLPLSRTVVAVAVDPAIALAFSIRRQRIRGGLTQKEAALRLGMKGVYSYQRLEKKCNPTWGMLYKLAHLFPSLSLDRVVR